MAPKNRIIIDTDPGVDDVIAILLALAATSEELEIVLISVTFGNIDVASCLRNIVTIFHVLDKELQWRKEQGLPVGFEGMTKFKPLVAVGAEEPLHDKVENADYFHGTDGLGGIHSTHPHHSPSDTWQHLFDRPPPDSIITDAAKESSNLTESTTSFTPSHEPAHKEILRLLRSNPADTITIVAIGPLTNCALAAAEDPEAFLRCKSLITMGGAVDSFGNVSPVAEFNVFADASAAARIYALTSPNPSSTMPPPPLDPTSTTILPPYPPHLSKSLKIILMSLDITESHFLTRRTFTAHTTPLATRGSPLADWMSAFMTPMLAKMERLHTGHEGDGAALALHDPLCVWYVLTAHLPGWAASEGSPEDIRVETQGQWTKGMTLLDRRDRRRRNSDGAVPHDRDNWLGSRSGNRVVRMLRSGCEDAFGEELLRRVLGTGGD